MLTFTPVFKMGYRGSKENYHRVSILPVMSKIFEKLLCKQLTVFADQNISKYQCGFREGFNGKDSLVAMLEKWVDAIDDKEVSGAHLTDLPKHLIASVMNL